jgi:hypothetical protein
MRDGYFIGVGILYIWLCVFFFPMIHDLFHELGHSAVALTSCGATTTSISLGEYSYCPHTPGVAVSFCVFPGWFYQSLFRRSQASYWAPFNGYDYQKCNLKLSSTMGGTFGLIFCWALLFLIVTPTWRFGFHRPLSESAIVGSTYVFTPLKYWLKICSKKNNEWPFAFKIILGLGAIVIQLDLINDFFYTYFPSRLIIWEYMSWGDGSTFWRASGVPEQTILNVSYLVWVLLFISYIAVFYSFYRFYANLKELKRVFDESQEKV